MSMATMRMSSMLAARFIDVQQGKDETPTLHLVGMRGLNATEPTVVVTQTEKWHIIYELDRLNTLYAKKLYDQLRKEVADWVKKQ